MFRMIIDGADSLWAFQDVSNLEDIWIVISLLILFNLEETSLEELSLVARKLFRRLFLRVRRIKSYVF